MKNIWIKLKSIYTRICINFWFIYIFYAYRRYAKFLYRLKLMRDTLFVETLSKNKWIFGYYSFIKMAESRDKDAFQWEVEKIKQQVYAKTQSIEEVNRIMSSPTWVIRLKREEVRN